MPVIIILFAHCSKPIVEDNDLEHKANTIQIVSSHKGNVYLGTFLVGHKASECNGCFIYGDLHRHLDCMGTGNECKKNVYMEVSADGDSTYFYAIISNPEQLTFEDFFVMPARSLFIAGTIGQFLNIPAQTCYRDEKAGTFIFYDLFYSDRQMFENR